MRHTLLQRNNAGRLVLCRERVGKALEILGVDFLDMLVLRMLPMPEESGTPLDETAAAMKVPF